MVLAKFKKHSEMDQTPKEAWPNPQGIQHTSNLKTKEKLTHNQTEVLHSINQKVVFPNEGFTYR